MEEESKRTTGQGSDKSDRNMKRSRAEQERGEREAISRRWTGGGSSDSCTLAAVNARAEQRGSELPGPRRVRLDVAGCR